MSEAAQEQLGRQLAALHLSGGSDRFGFDIDTSLGLALQNNSWSDTWVTFVQQQRIAPQLELAYGPYGGSGLKTLGEAFLPQLSEAFEGLKITPSLLHGDLWSGNAAADLSGQPVIFDPAYDPDRICHYASSCLASIAASRPPSCRTAPQSNIVNLDIFTKG